MEAQECRQSPPSLHTISEISDTTLAWSVSQIHTGTSASLSLSLSLLFSQRVLATQQPPVWNRHTVSTGRHTAFGYSHRMIVLHGDQPDDQFEAHMIIDRYDSYANATLYTTERPVADRRGRRGSLRRCKWRCS